MSKGIKLHPRPRTHLGRLWREWVEGYSTGPERLGKSLDYARAGNVASVDIEGETVSAIVWGSRKEPYRITWHFEKVGEADWAIFETLVTPEAMRDYRKGIVTAPFEASLGAAGMGVLPVRYRELKPVCNCPDWIRPCKHALAVLRILGDLVEDDPLLLLRLRGGLAQADKTKTEAILEPLRQSEQEFWGSPEQVLELLTDIPADGPPVEILGRLGAISIYGVKTDPEGVFRPVYEAVMAAAKNRRI